jgi:hypothetical protein
MRPRTLALIACLLVSSASARAATPTTRPRMPMVAKASATAAPHAASRTHAKAASKPHEPAATSNAGPRKLQDIHIEGEIPVPQVLFITARDQRRFVDFQQRRYLRTSRELAEQTNFPSRISLVGAASEARKETP